MDFKHTDEWIHKTHENMDEEKAYKTALANNESTESFNIEKRARTSNKLILTHNIPKYDETLFRFINETSQTISQLHNRILELETKISGLENKQ